MKNSKMKLNTNKRPFVMLYHDFIKCKLLNWNEKDLYIILLMYAEKDSKQCFPSINELCRVSGKSKNTILKAISGLESKRILKKEKRIAKNGQTSNLYTLYDIDTMWKSENIDELETAVDEIEERKMIEALTAKGYYISKEKVLVSEGVQTPDTSTNQNNFNLDNHITDDPKSQEDCSMSEAGADTNEPENQKQDSVSEDGTDATFDRLREQYLAIKGEKCNDSIDELESQEPQTSKASTDKPKSQEQDSASGADADTLFDRLWELYPVKKGKGRISAAQKKKLLKIGYDEMERAIRRYKKYVESSDYLHHQYGSTFFNEGYVDYLDANYDPESDRKAKGSSETKQKKNRFNDYPHREYDFDAIKRTMFLQ